MSNPLWWRISANRTPLAFVRRSALEVAGPSRLLGWKWSSGDMFSTVDDQTRRRLDPRNPVRASTARPSSCMIWVDFGGNLLPFQPWELHCAHLLAVQACDYDFDVNESDERILNGNLLDALTQRVLIFANFRVVNKAPPILYLIGSSVN